jgi:hypothetical protein
MKLYSSIARMVSLARMMFFALAALGMISNSHAKDAQSCPIRETEDSRREAFGALFGGRPQLTNSKNFSWDHAMNGVAESAGAPIVKSKQVGSADLNSLDAAESFSHCVVNNLQELASELPSFKSSDGRMRVLNELVGTVQTGSRFPKLRDRRTQQPIHCGDCRVVPLTVTYSDGVDMDSVRAVSLIIEMILNPSDFLQTSFRSKLELQWSVKTLQRSATFVWDQDRYVFLDARNIEVE